eukprot:5114929-Alexandrium_andersonii.AAC.1
MAESVRERMTIDHPPSEAAQGLASLHGKVPKAQSAIRSRPVRASLLRERRWRRRESPTPRRS